MKQGADWLAWSLQFIAGFFVGALIALAILSKAARHAGFNMTQDTVVPFILGPAFIGAGLASYYGDRLWIGDSYRIIPPDEIRQSDISRVVSIAAGILGGSLCCPGFDIFIFFRDERSAPVRGSDRLF